MQKYIKIANYDCVKLNNTFLPPEISWKKTLSKLVKQFFYEPILKNSVLTERQILENKNCGDVQRPWPRFPFVCDVLVVKFVTKSFMASQACTQVMLIARHRTSVHTNEWVCVSSTCLKNLYLSGKLLLFHVK